VLAQKSDYCYAMVNLGRTYIAEERWAEAEDILNDAAKCAPRMSVVYESLGFSLQKQGRLQDAINAYERSYEIKPSESVRSAIDICKQNIEVQQHNSMVAKEEQALDAADAVAVLEEIQQLARRRRGVLGQQQSGAPAFDQRADGR